MEADHCVDAIFSLVSRVLYGRVCSTLLYGRLSQGIRAETTGPFSHKRVAVFLRKRCEDGIVHPTKTDTAVSRSANLRIR